MEQVLFIVNPASGGQDKAAVLEQIDEKFSASGYTIYQTTGEDDKAKISGLIDELGASKVIAGGGDGTIAMLADILKGKDAALGILPLGSANGLAAELDIPLEIEESLDLIRSAPAKPFDLIEVNDKWNVLHLADIGLNATLVKKYQQDEHRGFLGYALSAIKSLPDINEPMRIEILTRGKKYSFISHFLGIANATKYGTGIVINPDGKVDDGLFELCILNQITFPKLLENVVGDEEFGHSHFTIISTNEARIQVYPPTDFQIDGEYIGEVEHLDVKVSSHKLQIIR